MIAQPREQRQEIGRDALFRIAQRTGPRPRAIARIAPEALSLTEGARRERERSQKTRVAGVDGGEGGGGFMSMNLPRAINVVGHRRDGHFSGRCVHYQFETTDRAAIDDTDARGVLIGPTTDLRRTGGTGPRHRVTWQGARTSRSSAPSTCARTHRSESDSWRRCPRWRARGASSAMNGNEGTADASHRRASSWGPESSTHFDAELMTREGQAVCLAQSSRASAVDEQSATRSAPVEVPPILLIHRIAGDC